MTNDFDLSETQKLAVARMIDRHDQPTTSRTIRLELQASLRRIFDAPTTATLSRARTVRKWCVENTKYERPERRYEPPSYLLKTQRPVTKWPARYNT